MVEVGTKIRQNTYCFVYQIHRRVTGSEQKHPLSYVVELRSRLRLQRMPVKSDYRLQAAITYIIEDLLEKTC